MAEKKILKQISVINALPHGLVSLTLLKRMLQLGALVVTFQIPLYMYWTL